MNLEEGYRTMFCFLDSYYWKNRSDELGGLLGSMSLLSDNSPVDPSYKQDWETAILQVIGKNQIDFLSSEVVYSAMITFLRNWAVLGTDGTVIELCDQLLESSSQSDEWLNAVKTVIVNKDDPHLYLTT